MNKSYRTVWNATTGTWAAAPETARMRTKSKSNATMKSSVTAAVAVMAGVGGGTMVVDANAQTAANGNGSLFVCGPSSGRSFGYAGDGSIACAAAGAGTVGSTLYRGKVPSFTLINDANLLGQVATGTGNLSLASVAAVSGSKDGHLVLLGGSGVHIAGPADFDNNVNMTNHRITGLANGTAGTDAVNLNQLNSAIAAANTANPYVVTNTGTYAAATAARAGGSATAVGANANASGISAVALGGNTVATGQNAVALGTLANATGNETVAVGVSARATGNNSTAMGRAAAAGADNSLALGYVSQVDTANSIALGANARVNTGGVTGANSSIAIGNGAVAGGTNSIMIGTNAQHSGSGATVLGSNASAMGGSMGVAVGYNSSAAGAGSVSLGTSALASGGNSVALGNGSVANADNTVSVGSAATQRRITNLATGTANTDAVNVGQLNTAIADAANPYVAINTGIYAAARAAQAGGSATALGANASATGTSAVALGGNTIASGQNAVALGTLARATGSETVSVGVGANAEGTNSTALGRATAATASGAVALGYFSVADRANTVSVGRAGAERQIVNVGAGTQATDAVNVSQLKGVTNALGGGADVGSNGNITNPTYNVGGTDYHNVGDALDALAASGIGNPNAVIYDDATKGTVTLGGTGATAPVALKNVADAKDDHDALNLGQLKNAGLVGDDGSGNLTSLAVTYDGAAKDSVTLGGAGATTPVALHNVADGVLSATSKDAVNGSQLFATNTRVGDLEDSLSKGGVIDPVTGESLAVVYDSNTKDTVTLKGTNGATLSNVK
ncbi:ESPR-type extended signal peptide-containing protein, partial [Burkholderia cenocepacia]|uniref:ESPR-type extended signal peptide-containing protein n=1 Tax=Burkholderia cenocepacia TaxID=95486 RepID=UPI0023542415